MNRQKYFNEISENLEILSSRIKTNGKLNVLDLNIHAEAFYRDLLNYTYGFKLKAANETKANIEAIDLIDSENKVVIQVSSSATKQKIESTLSKKKISDYAAENYTIKFLFIADEAEKLRSQRFANPNKIAFLPEKDIMDKVSILASISQLDIGLFRDVYILFIKEFKGDANFLGVKIINKISAINAITIKNLNVSIWLKEFDENFITGDTITGIILRIKHLLELINTEKLNLSSGVNSENSLEALFNMVKFQAPDLSTDLTAFYQEKIIPTLTCVNGFLEKSTSYYIAIGALGLMLDYSDRNILNSIMNNLLEFLSSIYNILDNLWRDKDYQKIEKEVINEMQKSLLRQIELLIDHDTRKYIKVIYDSNSIVDVQLADIFSCNLIEMRKKLYPYTNKFLSYAFHDNFSTRLYINPEYLKTFELFYNDIFGREL